MNATTLSPRKPAKADTADMAASSPSAQPKLADLAAAASADRNRAVDFYRAVAMCAVALGHWAAVSLFVDSSGAVQGGNALEFAPQMSWITWLFQVMPLFFVVGGFSSAISLDSHNAKGGRPQDWVIARLRRMVAPAVVLASTWLAILGVAYAAGVGHLAAAGAVAAAIPLWFLANYTIDTAIAPYVLPAFRRNPALVAGGGVALFLAIEATRFAGVPYLPQVNWVLGWLLFQVAGFAWRDGLLPTGKHLVATAGAFWVAALTAVTVGPYPTSMVNVPGLEHSPANPPTIALLLFGAAYSATALALAPAINRWLASNAPSSKRAWAAVVGANTVAMSVYLWHMTAAAAAGAVLYALGQLPTADVGTAAWWLQKMPLMGLSLVILAGLVAVVARFERRALLAPRVDWKGGQGSMLATAAIVSASIKIWVLGDIVSATVGMAGLFLAWHLIVKAREPKRDASSDEAPAVSTQLETSGATS